MPEINVTRLVSDLDPNMIAGSVATHGREGVKQLWPNATREASETPLETDDRDGLKDWARGFGAWEDEKIDAWTDAEIDALVLQYAAQDLKELQDLCPGEGLGDVDWTEADRLAESGVVGGHLFASGPNLFIHLE